MPNSTQATELDCFRRHRGQWQALVMVALLIAAATQMNGCAAFQPAGRAAVNVPQVRANSLALGLAERDQRLNSLQTPVVMEYSGRGGHFKAREQLVVRRPASIRVEAMSPLGIALVVAADGGQVAVFDPSKNTLMRGPATAETFDRFARIPMRPEEAVRLLMALAPNSAMLAFPPSLIAPEGDMQLIAYREPGGAVDELGFRGGKLAMVRERAAKGTVDYEVRYGDYRNIGAIDFPYEVDANFPNTGTTIKFHYQRPIVDGDVPDSSFVLSPGPSTRLLNLSRLNVSPTAPGA